MASESAAGTGHAALLPTYRDTIRPDWVDYNGHLRDAFYLLIFSFATDALMDCIGLDEAGRARTSSSLYTLESHINYLREVKLGAVVQVTTRLVGHDAKRLHIYHEMSVPDTGETVAASEQMLLHVDVRVAKSAVFSPDVMAHVRAIATAHSSRPLPHYLGRVIRLP